jgi:pimeloyl-ACP methyl ester carboxylesterase
MNTPHPAIFAQHLRSNPNQQRRSWYMGFFLLPFLPELVISANDYAAIAKSFLGDTPRGTFSREEITAYKKVFSEPGALTAALNWYRAAGLQGTRGIFAGTGMRCAVPTLLLWGEADRYLGPELVEGTEAFVPDLTVRRLPGVSHWLHHEAPDEVNRALLEHLVRTREA